MKRIVVFANKWWEADPLCWVVLHDQAHPSCFTDYSIIKYPTFRTQLTPGAPRPPDPPAMPRLTFKCAGTVVEIWCIQELMNAAENSSSSLEKARVLTPVLSAGATLVVAFGTAGSKPSVSANGSVIIGRRVFIHDPTAAGASGKWIPPVPDTVLDSPLSQSALRSFTDAARNAAEARLLRPPIAPADPPLVLVGNGFVSVGVVNVTNYDDYIWADQDAVSAFNKTSSNGQVGSIETTHGIVRSLTTSPFMYVSGITDADGLFDFQVTPRTYNQNVTAAHNAAVALAWFLPDLIGVL